MTLDLAALRLRKLLFGLSSARLRRALRHGVGAAIEHRAALFRLRPDLVLDLGANRGQFALIARVLWPEAEIRSFEPLPEPAARARAIMEGDDRIRIVVAAIGADRSTKALNVTRADDSSSLLPLGDRHRALYRSAVSRRVEVPVAPLTDFLAPGDLDGDVLLKIDTQGFELEILKGCAAILDRIRHIYVELSFLELYVGQPLASEAIAHLDRAGFELVGVHNVATDGAGQPVQADMLFRNRRGLIGRAARLA